MIYFIVNPTSRTGKSSIVWKKVEAYLQNKNIAYEAYITEYEHHAMELARTISRKEEPDICIIVVGGDGTMNEVINGIENFERIRFGLIPAGSGNDFARGLHIPKDAITNLSHILELVKSGENAYTEVDLGRVIWNEGKDSRLFGISSGVGMDAIVCKKVNGSKLKAFLNIFKMGKLAYIVMTIYTLFSMKTTGLLAKFDNEEKKYHKMIFMAAMNMVAEGGGVPMSPKASPFDGKLSVCSASGIPKWRTFLCLPFLVAAKHEDIKGFHIRDSLSTQIHTSKPVTLHADGEYCGEVSDVTFLCEPRKLHMIL